MQDTVLKISLFYFTVNFTLEWYTSFSQTRLTDRDMVDRPLHVWWRSCFYFQKTTLWWLYHYA